MSGVIVSVKGRYAVLLTKNSDFIKVKNKNYSVGDEVKIPQYKGQILAAAASFIVVCGGISSYFVPAKYMYKAVKRVSCQPMTVQMRQVMSRQRMQLL